MPHLRLPSAEIVRRGKEIYEKTLHAAVDELQSGRYLAIDVESGDFEIDDEMLTASKRLRQRHDDPPIFVMRIGYPTAVQIGAAVGDAAP